MALLVSGWGAAASCQCDLCVQHACDNNVHFSAAAGSPTEEGEDDLGLRQSEGGLACRLLLMCMLLGLSFIHLPTHVPCR